MNALIDVTLHRFGRAGYTCTVHGEHAIVFLDDATATGFRPGTTVTDAMLRFGDVFVVNYPHFGGFGAKRIVRRVIELTSQYEEVTLVALGTGGLLAYDIVAGMKSDRLPIIRLVLIDAMTSRDDMARWLRKRAEKATLTPWFPSPRWLSKRLHDPVPTECEAELTDEQRQELEVHREELAELPYATYLRRLAYAGKHPELNSEVLDGIPAVYIRSAFGPNSGAKTLAYDCWDTLLGGDLYRIGIDYAMPCGMLEYPTTWCSALLEAFDELGLKPVDDGRHPSGNVRTCTFVWR